MARSLPWRDSHSVRSQSALIRRVTENRHQHFSGCRHAALTDSVAVRLKRQFDITVSKQSLYGLWIGSDANQERLPRRGTLLITMLEL